MSEVWHPTRHELLFVVDVSPEDHTVRRQDGTTHRVKRVTLRYRRDEGPDSTWSEPVIGLGTASGLALWSEELTHNPQWLQDIECKAQPIDP